MAKRESTSTPSTGSSQIDEIEKSIPDPVEEKPKPKTVVTVAATNEGTILDQMDEPKDGFIRCVIPDFDPLLRGGNPGWKTQYHGWPFYLDRNGDLIGDLPEGAGRNLAKIGRVVLLEDHRPRKPPTPEQVDAARAAGSSLKVR